MFENVISQKKIVNGSRTEKTLVQIKAVSIL